MTSPVIDLMSVPNSPTVHRTLPTTTAATATTTTIILTTIPLPPQPQQVSLDSILLNRLGELKKHIADLVNANQALEERLDKHGSRLYRLENQDIPNQVSKAVDEIVTDALLSYLAEARKMKKKRQDSPKTPPGSPPHPPPPPLPPAGDQSTSTTTPSSSKTTASVKYTAWTTTDTRIKPSISSIHEELRMDDDTIADEQAYSSGAEDIRHDHIPTVNLRQILPIAPPPENYLLLRSVIWQHFMDCSKWKNANKLLTDQVDDAILRHSSEGDRRVVRTHMRILSVVRIEVFSFYGYDYMKKIVLRRADLKEYVIEESDFKYLYPSDFEDLYLLNLQGHLNHLSPADKKILTTAVNLWTRNLVIRQRGEDFQLGIESYQM
ncbi:hypothetical protein Tco_0945095 [Tanacetum coccineum]